MKYFISILFLVVCFTANSQSKTISGKIWNSENKEPLAYVNIGIKDKTTGTVSNENGLFTLLLSEKTNSKDTIVFSHIGYETQIIKVSELENKDNKILLKPETNFLVGFRLT